MIKSFLIGASAIVLTHSLAAQQLNTRRLDSLFSIYETGDRATGSIAISKNGQLLYKKVTGTADQKHPATENSLYRIGSISKTFTAALIMQLVDQQKLSLDQTLEGYFSRLPNAKTMTIRHLLNHTSGIPDYTASEEYIGYYTVDIKSKELEKVICDFQPSVLPGEMFQYSNSNYALLTFLLEKVNEQSYSELLTAKIINPLGLKQTFFDEEHPVVESYTFEEKWKTEANTKLCVSLGAGGIISTPGDLNTFYTADRKSVV